jgi:hypothetical protein
LLNKSTSIFPELSIVLNITISTISSPVGITVMHPDY